VPKVVLLTARELDAVAAHQLELLVKIGGRHLGMCRWMCCGVECVLWYVMDVFGDVVWKSECCVAGGEVEWSWRAAAAFL